MTQITGYIRRSSNRANTAHFYKILGLNTYEHQHDGPLHFTVTPLSADFVVEIYTASDRYPDDALIVEVDDLKKALTDLAKIDILPHQVIKEGFAVYVKDPDGKDVFFIHL